MQFLGVRAAQTPDPILISYLTLVLRASARSLIHTSNEETIAVNTNTSHPLVKKLCSENNL
jgi:hypothetical protein